MKKRAAAFFSFLAGISLLLSACGGPAPAQEHYAIVTYWRSFEEHERSHADQTFRNKFEALAAMCSESKEFGYEMLWQGAPE